MEAELRRIIGKLFLGGDPDYPIGVDTDLLREGICDSLGLVELASEVEARYPGLRIADQDITAANFASIGRMMAFLRSKSVA